MQEDAKTNQSKKKCENWIWPHLAFINNNNSNNLTKRGRISNYNNLTKRGRISNSPKINEGHMFINQQIQIGSMPKTTPIKESFMPKTTPIKESFMFKNIHQKEEIYDQKNSPKGGNL